MKKLLAALIVMCVMLSLASCEIVEDVLNTVIPPKSADDLYERIDDKMDSLSIYRVDMSGRMKFYVSGYDVQAEMTGVGIETDDDKDDYYFYDYIKSEMSSEELSIDETTEAIIAHSDGKTYIMNSGDGYEQKLFSKMSKEIFEELYSEENVDVDDFSKAKSKVFAKNEDGTWTLEYSQCAIDDIKEISDMMGIEDVIDTDIKDLKVKITAGKDFYVSKLSVEFVFDVEEDDEEIPELYFEMKYSELNTADRIEIDESKYTEVDDVGKLKIMSDGLKEAYGAKSGVANLSINQTVTYGSTTQKVKETDEITYGETNGKFYYDIVAVSQGRTINISYRDGKMTASSGTSSGSQDQTEAEAKAYVQSLINTAKYKESYVTDIEVVGDNVFRFKLNVDKSEYQSVMGSYQIFSVEATITVKLVDGKIQRIESVTDVTSISGPKLTLGTVVELDYN